MKGTLSLALPVALSFLGLMVMGLVDLLAVGRVGPAAVAAVGLGSSLFGWILVFGIGLLSGLDTLIAQAFGSGRRESCRDALAQGVFISLGLGLPMAGLLALAAGHLSVLGVNPEVEAEAGPFLRALAPSLPTALLFASFSRYTQAMGRAKPALLIILGANILNALGNYVLVFGRYGFPALGAEGSGWATTIARAFMALAAWGTALAADRKDGLTGRAYRYQAEIMGRLLRLGMPAGLQMLFEVGVFTVVTALASGLATHEAAAHQIVLNVASLTFMVPLGIGVATAVQVGQAIGAGDRSAAARRGWDGFALAVGFMVFAAITLLVGREWILGAYSSDGRVLEVAGGILLFAALFQVSDGAQTVLTGALRGAADTRTAAVANLIGHWGVGLPLGALLCFRAGVGLRGLWIGLSTGLTVVAIALFLRWRREVTRLRA